MPVIPTPGRVVIYHHSGEGLTADEPHDIPAMILAVSGGPISTALGEDATDLQTGEGPEAAAPDAPYIVTLELFRLRSKEWKRSVPEGEGTGQWSWPVGTDDDRLNRIEVALKAVHYPTGVTQSDGKSRAECPTCQTLWPCDTAKILWEES